MVKIVNFAKKLIPLPIKRSIYKTWRNYIQKKEFYSDLKVLKHQQIVSNDVHFILGKLYPCLDEKYANNGTAKGDYFHQDLLVANRIFKNNPQKHIDIGSRVDGFVAHVASFREIFVIDIRPSVGKAHNINFIQYDFLSNLDDSMLNSCDSLSCLHAMEHFGLGRYGDPVNFNGHIIGMNNLYRMLKPGGKLYFSVPIGIPQRIEFNAHRIFSPQYIVQQYKGKFTFDFFSYVDEKGDLNENQDLEKILSEYNDNYGCGIFEMTKL